MRRQRELAELRLSHLERVQRVSAQVAHDIRSPVAALRQLVSELTPRRREVALLAVERIADVSSDILGYERALRDKKESSSQGTRRASSRFAEVDIIAAARQVIDERNIAITGRFEGRVRFVVADSIGSLWSWVDPVLLRRVLSNVLTNALEAGGGETVDVEAYRNGAAAEIKIADRGAGIPEKVRSTLLAGGRITTKRNGHGLGLSHAIEIVRGWGGSISLDARPGRGSIVTLTLPLCERPGAEGNIAASATWDAMLVDDDVWVREAWSEAARSCGHRLLAVAEPAAALVATASFSKETPIFVDLELEGDQRGEDLVEELTRRGFANIFVATGHDPKDIDAILRQRVGGVFGKDYPRAFIARSCSRIPEPSRAIPEQWRTPAKNCDGVGEGGPIATPGPPSRLGAGGNCDPVRDVEPKTS
jgi:hypothetical protein